MGLCNVRLKDPKRRDRVRLMGAMASALLTLACSIDSSRPRLGATGAASKGTPCFTQLSSRR